MVIVVILGQYGENSLEQSSVKQIGITSPKMRQTLFSKTSNTNQKIGVPLTKMRQTLITVTIEPNQKRGIPCRGIVANNIGRYYKIRHKDNNEDELNHTEVEKYAKKYRGEGRMTGEIGQRMRLMKPLGD